MDFSETLKALKAGKKVKLPEFEECTYLELKNDDYYIKYKSGSIKNDFSAIPIRYTLAEDWEIVNDIPEVKLRSSEYFICPGCQHINYGFYLDDGVSTCKNCGKIVKTLPRDPHLADEALSYLKTKLGREFKSDLDLKNNIIEMCINPPDTITLTNAKGYAIKYVQEK